VSQRQAKLTVSLGRHKRSRAVCHHERRGEIESAFVGGRSKAAIAEDTAWQTGRAFTVMAMLPGF